MSNLIRRRTRETAPTRAGWDPFEIMREAMGGWEWPLDENGRAMQQFAPQFDVKETKDAYVFKADLPGVKESDLEISLVGNRLTISGKRAAEQRDEGETYFAYERSYGSFTRAFTLPEGCDAENVTAQMADGVLELVLPKKPEAQPKRISLKASGGAASAGKEKVKA